MAAGKESQTADFASVVMQRKLLFQVHFWIAITMLALGAFGVFRSSGSLRIIFAVETAVAWIAYQLGVVWSPPRRPWTAEERAARRLPPLPPGS